MTKPIRLPNAAKLAEVCEATWPPASHRALGAWTIREGRGGGNRVSAATEAWPVTDAELPEVHVGLAKVYLSLGSFGPAVADVSYTEARAPDTPSDGTHERHRRPRVSLQRRSPRLQVARSAVSRRNALT